MLDGRAQQGQRWPSLNQAGIKSLRAQPVIARTPHFALHYAEQRVLMPVLSTDSAPPRPLSVNNPAPPTLCGSLGVIAPKRHARRAVTRNLIKRQVREATRRWLLPAGDWLVRLRGPFEPQRCRSAASPVLRVLVRVELDELLRRACAASAT
jgi:ribonuclease P protein component